MKILSSPDLDAKNGAIVDKVGHAPEEEEGEGDGADVLVEQALLCTNINHM